MQAIPALFAKMGITAAAASTASAVIGGISTLASSMFQARVAKNNAAIAESNAQRAIQEASVKAQDQDIAARAEMGQMLASAGASGLSMGTGSLALQRKATEELAARDRGYTTYAGEAEAAGYKQQAQDFRTEAAGARMSGLFGLVSSGLDIAGSMISSASTVNAATARSIGTTSIVGGTKKKTVAAYGGGR